MTSDQARKIFLVERDRISHGTLKNSFFAGLQPCWDGTMRLSSEDVVFAALSGEKEACDIFIMAMKVWDEDLSPELDRLVKDVEGRFGFVVSGEWEKHLSKYSEAATELSAFSKSFQEGGLCKDAEKEASRFWSCLDVVKDFVKELKTDFGRFFVSWDPNLLKE